MAKAGKQLELSHSDIQQQIDQEFAELEQILRNRKDVIKNEVNKTKNTRQQPVTILIGP